MLKADEVLSADDRAVLWLIAAREQDFDTDKAFISRLAEIEALARAEAICRSGFRVEGE